MLRPYDQVLPFGIPRSGSAEILVVNAALEVGD